MAEHPDVARSNAQYITAQPVSPTGRTLPAAATPGATNRT
jgi:hypothetical protein